MTEKDLNIILKLNVGIALCFLSGSLFLWTKQQALAIAVGSIISQSNFMFLKALVKGWVMHNDRGNQILMGVFLFFKFILLFFVLALSVIYFNLHLGGLLIGLSTLGVSIIIVFLKNIWNMGLLGFN